MKYPYTYFKNLYDHNYQQVTWDKHDKHRNERFRRIASWIQSKDIVLDYGGGNGDLKKFLTKTTYHILDLSDEHSFGKTKRISLREGIYIDSPANSYDVVVMSEIMEHIPNCFETLQEVRRVLKENGIIIITVPNPFSLFYILRSVIGKHQDPSHEHLYWFDWSFLSNLLNAVGFTCRYKTTFNLFPSKVYQKIYNVDRVLSKIMPYNGSQLFCVFEKNGEVSK